MSYDLQVAVKVADADKETFAVIAIPEEDSPTYNLGDMFRACTGWDFEQGVFYRVSGVYSLIEHGINELTYNEEAYQSLNPSNGWGNTQDALSVLKSLKDCIDKIAKPEWGEGLPMKCLWVAW